MNKENLMLLSSIYSVEETVLESELSVMEHLSDYYNKCSIISEYVSDTSVEEMFYAEGAKFDKMDEWAHSKTEGNVFKKAVLGVLKLITRGITTIIKSFQRIRGKETKAVNDDNVSTVQFTDEEIDKLLEKGVDDMSDWDDNDWDVQPLTPEEQAAIDNVDPDMDDDYDGETITLDEIYGSESFFDDIINGKYIIESANDSSAFKKALSAALKVGKTVTGLIFGQAKAVSMTTRFANLTVSNNDFVAAVNDFTQVTSKMFTVDNQMTKEHEMKFDEACRILASRSNALSSTLDETMDAVDNVKSTKDDSSNINESGQKLNAAVQNLQKSMTTNNVQVMAKQGKEVMSLSSLYMKEINKYVDKTAQDVEMICKFMGQINDEIIHMTNIVETAVKNNKAIVNNQKAMKSFNVASTALNNLVVKLTKASTNSVNQLTTNPRKANGILKQNLQQLKAS